MRQQKPAPLHRRASRSSSGSATSTSFWLLLSAASAVHAFDGSPPNRHSVDVLTLWEPPNCVVPVSTGCFGGTPQRATLRRKGIDPTHSPCRTRGPSVQVVF